MGFGSNAPSTGSDARLGCINGSNAEMSSGQADMGGWFRRMISFAFLSGLAGCAVAPGPADDGNRLVFWRGNVIEITRVLDGRATTERTIRHGSLSNVIDATSTGEELIVVSFAQPGDPGQNYSARVIGPVSGEVRQELQGPNGYIFGAAISPDRDRAAFSVCEPGPVCRIDLENIDGGARRAIANGVERHSPVSWSPDGGQLAFSAVNGRIGIVDISSGAIAFWGRGSEPDWSPNGRMIVFQTAREIRVLDLATKNVRTIHEQDAAEYNLIAALPRWSRDGGFISFNVPDGMAAQWMRCKVYSLKNGTVTTVRSRSDKFCGPWTRAAAS